LPYPKGWQTGKRYKVHSDDGIAEFTLTRWRGLARVVDADGTEYMVRRWRDTKAAAIAATERAGQEKLAALESARLRAAQSAALAAEGDLTTTVGDLLEQVMVSPSTTKLAPRTRGEYVYVSAAVREHDGGALAAMLPRKVDVATVRAFLESFAQEHGTYGAVRAKALLRKAMDLAAESNVMRAPINPVAACRDAIPNVKVQQRRHETKHTPTDAEVEAFLSALRDDPAAGPMVGPRLKSRHGEAGSVVNGTDVADLLAVTFGAGLRIGEATALRWADLTLRNGNGAAKVSGTVIWVKGQGAVRQERTKTRGSSRTVPLRDDLVAMLRERALLFGIDMADPEHLARPVFPSPQRHGRWRDPSNLAKAIRSAMDRHGLEWASSHTGRRWRVTSLLDRGVPLRKIGDVVGHVRLETTLGYVGRDRATDDDVRAAL